ncbi:GAF domain-containing protein, partial [Klebsiella variicola]
KRAYCLKIQPATGSFARNLIYSTKPTAVAEERILCINNVHSFNGHIVCDTASNSEIVLPVRINNTVVGALDIDSPAFSRFSSEDEL